MKRNAHLRGLHYRHQQERARWRPIVDGGGVNCCLCGEPIVPGSKWDLDHTPDRRNYRGPAHAHCNRSDGARRGNPKRKLTTSRVW